MIKRGHVTATLEGCLIRLAIVCEIIMINVS